jgi:hypothetical protein
MGTLPNPVEAYRAVVAAGKRRHSEIMYPDVAGLEEVASLLTCNHRVAVPTECTYEVLEQHQPVARSFVEKSSFRRPHVYLPNVSSLETSTFWKQQLPKKSYGMRNNNHKNGFNNNNDTVGDKQYRRTSMESTLTCLSPGTPSASIATFNETVQVLRRVSSKVWPGPMKVYMQVRQPISGLTITIHRDDSSGCFTNESTVQHYLAVRSASHPLTVKVCHEFYKSTAQQTTPPDSPKYPSSSAGESTSQFRLPSPVSSPKAVMSRATSMSSLSSMSSFGAAGATSSHAYLAPLLVGWPMVLENRFVTAASQVEESDSTTAVTAVLNGEERRERFAVPTCQHGQPWTESIWIDTDRRLIRLVKPAHHRYSPDSVAAGVTPTTGVVTDTMLMQALRSDKQPKTNKERIIQAVMLKWKIVTEYS